MKNIWHTPDETPVKNTLIIVNRGMYWDLLRAPENQDWEMFKEEWCKGIQKYAYLNDMLSLESKIAELVTTLKDVQVFFDNFTEADLADFTTTAIRVKNTLKDIGG